MTVRIALVAIALAVTAPALGQEISLQGLLAGRDQPLVLTLKDLNAEWRRLTITSPNSSGGMGDTLGQLAQLGMMSQGGKGKSEGAEAAMGMALLNMLFGGGDSRAPVYYTRGLTLSLGGETFLVAYKADRKQSSIMELAMQAQASGGKEPDPQKMMEAGKLSGDTPVALALINIRSIGTIYDVRPFDLQREIEESAAAGAGGLMGLFGAMAADKSTPPQPKVTATKAKPPAAPRKKP